MKATIEVSTRTEAEEIRVGLADPQVRAFVRVVGVLARLTSDRARSRVLTFVSDHLAERAAREQVGIGNESDPWPKP